MWELRCVSEDKHHIVVLMWTGQWWSSYGVQGVPFVWFCEGGVCWRHIIQCLLLSYWLWQWYGLYDEGSTCYSTKYCSVTCKLWTNAFSVCSLRTCTVVAERQIDPFDLGQRQTQWHSCIAVYWSFDSHLTALICHVLCLWLCCDV